MYGRRQRPVAILGNKPGLRPGEYKEEQTDRNPSCTPLAQGAETARVQVSVQGSAQDVKHHSPGKRDLLQQADVLHFIPSSPGPGIEPYQPGAFHTKFTPRRWRPTATKLFRLVSCS